MKLSEFRVIGLPRSVPEWVFQMVIATLIVLAIIWMWPETTAKWVGTYSAICVGSLVNLYLLVRKNKKTEERSEDD